MATAIEIIRSALLLNGAVAADQTLSSTDAQDGLTTLNEMLESWALENLTIPAVTQEVLTLSAGTNPYTIGPSGTFNTVRPIEIVNATVRNVADNVEYKIELIGSEEYSNVRNKAIQSTLPTALWYNPSAPLGYLYLWPVPAASGWALVLTSYKPFTAFSGLTDSASFPPGYLRAIRYNLAIELAQYSNAVPVAVANIAQQALMNLKIANHKSIPLRNDATTCGRMLPNIMTNQL